jgi:hypothetical protein
MSRLLILLALAAVLSAGCGTRAGPAGLRMPAVAARASVSSPPTFTAPTANQADAHGSVVRGDLTGSTAVCGRTLSAPATYRHVVWIWLENRSYGEVIGPPGSAARRSAPYLNRLAESCGLATNYHNVSHPSQPNYFAAVAGTTGGVTVNCESWSCPLGDRQTLFTQLTATGRQFRSYEESMPEPCDGRNAGKYVDRHNPEVYFSSDEAQCRAWDIPLGTDHGGPLVTALNTDTLPAFSFVTPNVCSDMHSCATAAGDRWLSHWVPKIVDSPGYQEGDTALFITFDEGEHGRTYDCASNTTDVGCHVAMVVVAPSTPSGTRAGTLFNHYSLLRTTEQLLGISSYLGQAATANSMVTAFNL